MMHEALSTLSQAEQDVLKLAFFEDKSQSVIATQLGIPLGTVKSRMRLSFGKLRVAMSEMLGDDK
jgi:RNA polymerase sigma factor (sigma-70 family)